LVLAGLVVSGAWTQLDEIGWIGWAPLVIALVLDAFPPSFTWPRRSWPTAGPDRSAMVAAAALCGFVIAHLLLTAREEFGFTGDEGYHLGTARAFTVYFSFGYGGVFLAAVIAVYGVLAYRRYRFAASVAIAGLIVASYFLPANRLFGRYPAGFYLIAMPLNMLFEALHSPHPQTANHIVNALSLPMWLFVLRPLIIGRWPDWRVLIVALLVYFQPPALTLIVSSMLEPWAVVFALLSLEALVVLPVDRRWLAVALCAIAICFKETMILLLPPIWILACVEWRNRRPRLRPGSIALGAAAVAPFVVYYAIRKQMTTARGYAFGGTALFTHARAIEWLSNARGQIGVGGMITVAMAGVLSITSAPLLVATAVAAAVFFLADAISVPWTGYSRFLAYSLLAICGAVFAKLHRRQLTRRSLMVICAAIVALQLPATFAAFALDFRPDHERNGLEWRGGLVRMPIRALASQIPVMPGGERVRKLRVTAFAIDLVSLRMAYPDLAAAYLLIPSVSDCSCRQDDEAVLGVFKWPANLGDTPEARDAYLKVSTTCVATVESTCAANVIERDRSGAPIGVLGIGRLSQ
jgi:hypothetical protein